MSSWNILYTKLYLLLDENKSVYLNAHSIKYIEEFQTNFMSENYIYIHFAIFQLTAYPKFTRSER